MSGTGISGLNDCFTIGSVVSCKTCLNKHVQGEVMAFDPHTRILILKCPATNGRTTTNDVYFVNLSLVSDIAVISEAPSVTATPVTVNVQKISTRLKNAIEEKQKLVEALKDGVSPEGQRLFMTLMKTVPEVCWRGENIVVYNNVVITPPYQAENMLVDNEDVRALSHIRKIVEKHIKDTLASSAKE